MAALSAAVTFAQNVTQTDANGIINSNAIVYANAALLDVRREFIKSGVDSSGVQEAYRDATAGTGTYLYPTDLFFLKAIELNYTDTTSANYITAQQIDVSNVAGQNSFSWLRTNATVQNPQFDDHGDWFEIFPTPTSANSVSQLIRIFYYKTATEFVATTDTINYPESLDYRVLGWGIAAYYLYSLLKIQEGDKFMAKATQIIQDMRKTLGRGSQQPTVTQGLPISGYEF